MTPRSIRRAAEHKALKQARKADKSASERSEFDRSTPESSAPENIDQAVIKSIDTAIAETVETPAPSEARLAANRANSKLSSGPRSTHGKSKSSINALKTALTGRTVLLPTDDVARYQEHVEAFFHDLKPIGARECELAQSLADIAWRLIRTTTLEMAIYAHGRSEFETLVANEAPEARPALLDMHTFLNYERQLRNLGTQEARLYRQHEKQSAEFKELQRERTNEERGQLANTAKLYLAAKKDRKPFHPEDHGFDFSIDDVEAYLNGVRAAAIARETFAKERQARTSHASAA